MDSVELLTVEDSFLIKTRGAVLIPDFSVPNGWKNQCDVAVIETPDGQQITTKAQFNLTHFNMSDPTVSAEKRWRIVVTLPDWQMKVPVGSKLFVSAEIQQALAANPV